MGKLFEYGKCVDGQEFVGRKEDVARLSANFIFQTNTIVIAPQGWGKSSLVRKASEVARKKDSSFRLCYVDLSNVRDEERMLILLAESVFKAVSGTVGEFVENVRKYFMRFMPKMDFGAGSVENISLDFDWGEVRNHRDIFIDLPYNVAKAVGLKITVCLDSFHSVDSFTASDTLLNRLQDSWILHKGVSYCLCGCGTAMMEDFAKTSKPFYMYGDIIRLGRIAHVDMIKSVRDRFADTGKYIDNEMAGLIAEMVSDSPFYIQQLAHLAWMNTSVVCSREVVLEAHSTIVDQMHLLFSTITSGLTSQQLCYLHAIIAGETIISSSEVLHRHRISSATSASRSKAALLQSGIICNADGKIMVCDPLYSYWLKHRYFNDL